MSVAAVQGGTDAGRQRAAGHDGSGTGLKPGWGVSPGRQQQITETLRHLAPHSGRLSPGRLRAITVALSACRELWADLVVHDPDVRWYLPLHRSNSCDVWLLAWERGQDTDWHDHGGSSGSFAVADGSLIEQYRVPSGRRLARRQLSLGEAVAFGPGHVHDVAHGGGSSATSIHAYSPPLSAMTYYSATDYGLIARETVAIDGPEGARGRGGADTALAQATASAARLTFDALPGSAPGIDELLAEARSGLTRLRPEAAFAAITDGAVLVDIRPQEQRNAEGEVPGAIIIGRNVLEWRLDPRSEARIPALARPDIRAIVMCSQGYASSLAATSLRRLGLHEVTDLDGGFQAWHAAGLPTRPAIALASGNAGQLSPVAEHRQDRISIQPIHQRRARPPVEGTRRRSAAGSRWCLRTGAAAVSGDVRLVRIGPLILIVARQVAAAGAVEGDVGGGVTGRQHG